MAGKNLIAASLPAKAAAAKPDAVQIVQDAVKLAVEATIHAPHPATAELAAPQTIAPAQATVSTTPVAATQKSAHAVMEKTMKTAEEFVSFGQGNVEALMKCGQIWAAGVQDLHKSFAATAQAQLDQTVSTWKALAGVKSIKEAMELHTSLARNSMGSAVAETGKLTDASMKLAEQTMAPIAARVSLAVEKFGRAA